MTPYTVEGVESLEIHPGTEKLFQVYTHGEVHRSIHADDIDITESISRSHLSDPNTGEDTWYQELIFEEPTDLLVDSGTLRVSNDNA